MSDSEDYIEYELQICLAVLSQITVTSSWYGGASHRCSALWCQQVFHVCIGLYLGFSVSNPALCLGQGKVPEDGPTPWTPASTWHTRKKLPAPRQINTALGIEIIWGLNQWIKALSLSLSLSTPLPHLSFSLCKICCSNENKLILKKKKPTVTRIPYLTEEYGHQAGELGRK